MHTSIIDSYVWLSKDSFTPVQLDKVRGELRITPIDTYKGAGSETKEDLGPILLFKEDRTYLGVARGYFFSRLYRRSEHFNHLDDKTTLGDKSSWPGDLQFSSEYSLRGEQVEALASVKKAFRGGSYGGIVKAPCGWGKTVFSCAAIAEMNVPTLVIVNKDFLMKQWVERINTYLPDAKVGMCVQDECDFEGKHIVIAMVHSLGRRDYGEKFYNYFGLVVVDEVHRISARTWAPVPGKFPARWRLGLSATPRRKDGTEKVFLYELGSLLFEGVEKRLTPEIKRVYTDFRVLKGGALPDHVLIRYMVNNKARNDKIADLVFRAFKSGRKPLVMSKQLKHLAILDGLVRERCRDAGLTVTTGFYVGQSGKNKDEILYNASQAQIVFTTAQMAAEALDIPPLDTLIMVYPMSDVEQAVGRILRPYEGKQSPIVIDIRDPEIPMFEAMARTRERIYEKLI